MRPTFQVLAEGINITPQIKDRLRSLVPTDNAGAETDTAEIELETEAG